MRPIVRIIVAVVTVILISSTAFGENVYICYDNGIRYFSNTVSSANCRFYRSYGSAPRYRAFGDIPYKELIYTAAGNAGIDPSLLVALVETESYYDYTAISNKGAKGLCQLMDDIIKFYGVRDPFDPEQNLRAGAQHLADLIDRFRDLELALAAYNAGSGAVVEHKGTPPYQETQNFVNKVMGLYRHYRSLLGDTTSSSLKK